MNDQWQFWIDVGGTFTDCIGVAPDGVQRQFKTLSSGVTRGTVGTVGSKRSFSDPVRSDDPGGFWTGATLVLPDNDGRPVATSTVTSFDADEGTFVLDGDISASPGLRYELDLNLPAPVLGIRWLLGLSAADSVPPVQVRFGTTRGTNALLTRTGARTALVTTAGFADVPLIGNQDRPDLFDLNIRKPTPLFETVVEVSERIATDGTVVQPLDRGNARTKLQTLVDQGIESIAICLLNAWAEPRHEIDLLGMCLELGFDEVSHSFEVAPQIRLVPRCDTTVLDAYLNPVLRRYLDEIHQHLSESQILMMTSAGGLVDHTDFRGRDSILSGPAGGIVGFAQVAQRAGFDRAIGFDMGGTSTDVARFGGHFEYERETTKAGIRVMTPVLAIETVAAGGGSICGFDGVRLFVGPASAGASPGPACYGSGGRLTVTDLNVFVGRVLPDYFPFRLDRHAVVSRLAEVRSAMKKAGAWHDSMSLDSLAEGLLQIANDNMVQAIRRVSVARGYDPADHVLVSFGGAGGQHACAMARALRMKHVLLHPSAGILSAWGMGQADIRQRRTVSVLQPLLDESLSELRSRIDFLIRETRQHVERQGVPVEQLMDSAVELDLRYRGTESLLTVPLGSAAECYVRFEEEYQRQFGYTRVDCEIEIAALSVETVGCSSDDYEPAMRLTTSDRPAAEASTKIVFAGSTLAAKVYLREALRPGDQLVGPAILCEPTSTIFIEPQCEAEVLSDGSVLVTVDGDDGIGNQFDGHAEDVLPDPVLLEVFNNQFVSIAEQMGEALRRTSVSTNVRERLDYSCALFDGDGRLVVNAPHVPVHLGAMGETVRAVILDHPGMEAGDVFVTNDPYRGGSHLPDITVITPVFISDERPAFFVANRAHHAEIGGIVPGSMPPFSQSLAEEGVLIRSQHLVRSGKSCEDDLRVLLSAGRYPSRSVDDNLADLAAQVAANTQGSALLTDLCSGIGVERVQRYMRHVQDAAEQKIRQVLRRLEDRRYTFVDQLDDGTVIQVAITVRTDQATIDFSGTSGVHSGNLNANRAITTAAVLYAFRCLLNEDVPLNAGVLAPLTLVIPEGLLSPPAGETPDESPAIVGGNVETSQRIVDVLLGALGLVAASQGTMNNLTFGDESFGYYETICGGAGATPSDDGADAVHTHMTNTRLTDPEVLEQRYPVRLHRFQIRQGSGGSGTHRGGHGVIREIEFLRALRVSMLSQRRTVAPWGMQGGLDGACGRNGLFSEDGSNADDIGGVFSSSVTPGDRLRIETPGGGGCGKPPSEES